MCFIQSVTNSMVRSVKFTMFDLGHIKNNGYLAYNRAFQTYF